MCLGVPAVVLYIIWGTHVKPIMECPIGYIYNVMEQLRNYLSHRGPDLKSIRYTHVRMTINHSCHNPGMHVLTKNTNDIDKLNLIFEFK